jgi:hypothetical protein
VQRSTGRFVGLDERDNERGNNDPEQESDDGRARNTTLNTAKRASQRPKDVRDPTNKRRLAPKPRQLMSTCQRPERSFSFFRSILSRSLFCCRRHVDLQKMYELYLSISTPYGPASDAVLQSDWLLVQGGLCSLFPRNDPTRSLRGLVLRRRSNPLFPFGDQCATRLLFITRHRESWGNT